ncbi:MAG: PAS domain S-box protein, partial [Bacteroidota bacterium]
MKTKSFTILNVDDSVEYLRTHSHFLKSKGYTVLEATTGNECLRLTKKHKPDLILLDVVLPDIYGIEVCRQIKTNVDTKQTLILLISGYEIGSDAQVRGFEAGADDYLVKPISKNELLAHVRVMERIKRSEDELREVALLLEQRVKERTNAIEKINQELQNEIAKHKRAEEALRESEQRFQVLTENSPVGIFQTDAKGSTIYVNPRWCQISGLSKEEAMGSGWLSAVHSEDKKKLSNGWKKATQAHDSSIADYRFVHKDGTITWVIGQAIPERNSKNKIVGYVGTITDINEHKRAEEELSALTIRQQAILAAVPDIIMEVDNNKIYTWVNKAGIDFFGKDVIGKEASYYFEGTQDTYDVVHPLFIGDENTIYVESWQRRKDGEKRLLAWWCRVLKDRSGNVIGALSSARDITERKRAEEALRESEEKFRILFETMPNGFYRSTPEGYYVDVNPAFVKMLGYDSKEELLNVYIPTDIYVRAIERDVFVRENEDFVNNLEVYRLKTKDGRIIWLEENARYIKDENGRVIYNEGICRDITERKHVEEALLQEQYLMNMLMDNVPDHIYFKDTDSRFIRINKDHAKKFGLSNPTQATGKTDFDFFTEEHARPAFEDEQTIIRTGKPIVGIEEKETWPDGQETWVSTTKMPLRDKEGNIIGTFGISRDITERKRAEEQIAMLAHAVRSINECVSITDTNNNIVFVNQAFLNTYGYTEQDLLGKNISLVRSSKISDEEIEKIRLSTLEGSWHGELMNKRKDGSEFPIFLSTTTVHDNEGKPIALIGVATDITERKQAEETLSLLNHTIKSTSECISITDLNNKILFVNQAFLKTYGYIEEEVVGKPIYIVRAEKIENKDIVFDTTLQGSWHGELLNRKKDGTVFPVSLSTSVVHNEKKQPIALVGVAVDITERKQADEALRESEAKLIEAMKIARLGTWEYDVVRDQFTFNDQFYKLLHTTAEREGGYIMSSAHYAQKFVYPDDVSVVGMEIQKALETTDPDYYSELDHRIICVDGEIGYITVHIRIVKDAQGRTVKTHGVNQDITERKRAEEALQESELRFRSLYENATIGIYRTTPDGNILLANPALVKMLGYTSFHKLAERNLEKDGFESSSQRKEFLEKIERDGEVHGYDSKWMRQDDSAIFVLESARAIRDSQGKTLYYDGTVEDITERKLLEEQMRQVQKLEGLGTLAGGIAHDFNNILGIILAYITSAKRFKDDAKKLDLAV